MPVSTTEMPPGGGASAYPAPKGQSSYAALVGQLAGYLNLGGLALLLSLCQQVWDGPGHGRITIIVTDRRCVKIELAQSFTPEKT